MFDVVLTLSNQGLTHLILQYNMLHLLIDMGGYIVSIYIIFKLLNSIALPDRLVHDLAPKFYRKPEIYKYAHAEKLDQKPLVDGEVTLEQFNNDQYDVNVESMSQRTHAEIEGHLKKPSYWELFCYHLFDQFSLNPDKTVILDKRCYEYAK